MIWADTASTDNKISVGRWNGSGDADLIWNWAAATNRIYTAIGKR